MILFNVVGGLRGGGADAPPEPIHPGGRAPAYNNIIILFI